MNPTKIEDHLQANEAEHEPDSLGSRDMVS
jgi:hypothetical protein